MRREVVEVLMDQNVDVSGGSSQVLVAPKVATEEEFEVKECTEVDSLQEKAPSKTETPERNVAQKSTKVTNGNAKVSKPLDSARKPLHPENKKHIEDDDTCSMTSSVATSMRMGKSGLTYGSAPTFKSAQRAEKRREYYQKLEEKHKMLEAEKNELEQRQKEEQEAALKKLRKNLKIKAKPVPNFYYEAPPAKAELKKPPLTRPKSPKLTTSRRKSLNDAISSSSHEDSPKTVPRRSRHSTGTVQNKDGPKKTIAAVHDSPRVRSGGKVTPGLKSVKESSGEASCEA